MAHYRERWAHHVRVISNVCQKCRIQNSSRRSSISLSNIPKDTIVSLVDYEVYRQTIYMFFFGFSTRFLLCRYTIALLTYTKNELNFLAIKTAKKKFKNLKKYILILRTKIVSLTFVFKLDTL